MVTVELWALWSFVSTNRMTRASPALRGRVRESRAAVRKPRSVSGGRRQQPCGAGTPAARVT